MLETVKDSCCSIRYSLGDYLVPGVDPVLFECISLGGALGVGSALVPLKVSSGGQGDPKRSGHSLCDFRS
jgi:hypothetical protein